MICDISYSYLYFLRSSLIIQTRYDKFLLPSGWICCPVHKDCFSDCAMFPPTLPHRNSSITKSKYIKNDILGFVFPVVLA